MKYYPDFALANISDPFAGYSGPGISLITNFDGPGQYNLVGVKGSREQNYYQMSGGFGLPGDIGDFYGALVLEELGDAQPRWNVNSALPHNSLDNIEFYGGGGLNINRNINARLRMFYKNYDREYYLHNYYFNFDHAPRQKGYVFNGNIDISGWVSDRLFLNACFGIDADDDKYGDGMYLDDLQSYLRFNGNPGTDDASLFWSWDDIDGVTPDIDESHVFDDYYRHKTSGNTYIIGADYILISNIKTSIDLNYSIHSFRKYASLTPVLPYSESIENIGFDSLGIEENDLNGIYEIPKPKELTVSLGLKSCGSFYGLTGLLDYIRFDPGALAVLNIYDPFDSDDLLDREDLHNAEVKTKVGFRLSGALSSFPVSARNNIGIFANYSINFTPPSYYQLYNGYVFFENKILRFGYFYPLGNPELKLQKTTQYEGGLLFSLNDNRITISYKHRSLDNIVSVGTIQADPKGYQLFYDADFGESNALTLSYHKGGNSFIRASLMGELGWNRARTKFNGGISLIGRYFYDDTPSGRRLNIIEKVFKRTQLDIFASFNGGFNYTPMKIDADPVTLLDVSYNLAGPFNSGSTDDRLEINIGATIRLLEIKEAAWTLRLEILNLLNANNYVNVYSTTGQPDETGWLYTQSGETWLETINGIHDSSGMTGLEKYLLKQNDPNNFGRPRLFRVMARLDF
jgi:hypothetical protein